MQVDSPFTSYANYNWTDYGYDFYYDSAESQTAYYDPGMLLKQNDFDFSSYGFESVSAAETYFTDIYRKHNFVF